MASARRASPAGRRSSAACRPYRSAAPSRAAGDDPRRPRRVPGTAHGAESGAQEVGNGPQGAEAEVSQPHEPAEQEADAVGDRVAGELHDEGAAAHGADGKGRLDEAREAGLLPGPSSAAYGGGAGAAASRSSPAPISAKLEGGCLQWMRAPAPPAGGQASMAGGAQGATAGAASTTSATGAQAVPMMQEASDTAQGPTQAQRDAIEGVMNAARILAQELDPECSKKRRPVRDPRHQRTRRGRPGGLRVENARERGRGPGGQSPQFAPVSLPDTGDG
jgi:hypothetical protein